MFTKLLPSQIQHSRLGCFAGVCWAPTFLALAETGPRDYSFAYERNSHKGRLSLMFVATLIHSYILTLPREQT